MQLITATGMFAEAHWKRSRNARKASHKQRSMINRIEHSFGHFDSPEQRALPAKDPGRSWASFRGSNDLNGCLSTLWVGHRATAHCVTIADPFLGLDFGVSPFFKIFYPSVQPVWPLASAGFWSVQKANKRHEEVQGSVGGCTISLGMLVCKV